MKLQLLQQMVRQTTPPREQRMEDHCPDYVITIEPTHKVTSPWLPNPLAQAVVLTILGTRMFPKPNTQDIIMDLAGRTCSYLGGEAHSGMVAGCRKLEELALPRVLEELARHPGFSLLVIGYSLGAGLAQLFARLVDRQSLLPPGTVARAVCFGCPPVFLCSADLAAQDNVLAVTNNNDGITAGSLGTIDHLFHKTRVLQKLAVKRRTLVKLALGVGDGEKDEALEDIDTDEEDEAVEEEEEPQIAKKPGLMSRARNTVRTSYMKARDKTLSSSDAWEQVEEAISAVPYRHPPLTITAGRLLLLRKNQKGEEEDKVTVRSFSGPHETRQFSQQLRLKMGMFECHMPWGYNSIFAGDKKSHG